jgi:hypothetical protein
MSGEVNFPAASVDHTDARKRNVHAGDFGTGPALPMNGVRGECHAIAEHRVKTRPWHRPPIR